MPLILAVDATGEEGSLALFRDGVVLEEALLHAPTGYGPVLYRELEALLLRHDVRLAQVDCFAAASGPGTFTGVRVGLACVMGLAEAVNRPAVAVSNLAALARFGSAPLRAVALDARRGDVYGAAYDEGGNEISPEVVAKPGVWLESLPDGIGEFLICGVSLDLAESRFAQARVVAEPRALASAVAAIAAQRFARGEAGDPASLDANYVRRSDAELSLKLA
ncbi:MAG: tRNA (adenosine(37)-N6)-threonylcarbamoyltransferase complex dimerization subunit type 1 TsaB [Candidatus Solibacter sp.]